MRIFQNLRYKLLALTIALLLWTVARGTSNIDRGFDIPIVFQGVPENLVIVDESASEVNVRVMGSRAALRNVSQGLEYGVDVSGAKQGVGDYEIDVSRLDLPRGVKPVSRSPSRVEVRFERRGTKVVRVRADLEGEPLAGFQLGTVEVEPPRVRIAGARSEVLRLDEVITEAIDLSGLDENLEREVRLSVGAEHAWVEEPRPVLVRVQIVPVPEGTETDTGQAEEGQLRGAPPERG
jgi:YbbR domain-containing protein